MFVLSSLTCLLAGNRSNRHVADFSNVAVAFFVVGLHAGPTLAIKEWTLFRCVFLNVGLYARRLQLERKPCDMGKGFLRWLLLKYKIWVCLKYR